MYIITNALKNLGRNKGRNFLMSIIILAIIIAAAISIIINTTTASIIKDYKDRFGAKLSIDFDMDNLTEEQFNQIKEGDYPTARQLLGFAESDYLLETEIESTTWAIMPELIGDASFEGDLGDACLLGSSRTYIDEEFKKGTKKIVEGSIYKELGECLVEKSFADEHGLSVGDSISASAINLDPDHEDANADLIPYNYKISGIYTDHSRDNQAVEVNSEFTEILIHTDTAIDRELFDLDKDEGFLFCTYYLKSPDLLDSFRQELKEKGLSDYMKVFADEEGYKKVVAPVEGLGKISMTFMIVILVLGLGILLILSILTIRERKYEIGVLRAMGMKKVKVMIGFLTETILITSVCLLLGFGIGSVTAQKVADSLLEDQLKAIEESQGSSEILVASTKESPLEEIEINIGMDAMVRIIFVALLAAGISSITGILYITRYEPMRILSERN